MQFFSNYTLIQHHFHFHSMDVHVFYDDSFNNRFGVNVITRINTIFSMVRTMYSHFSLTAVIEPNVIAITYQSGQTWTANENSLKY